MLHFFWFLFAALVSLQNASPQSGAPLHQVQVIALSGVEGRIDHMAADTKGERLYVAALGNNTLEVVDLKAGNRVHSIGGMHEPQGVRVFAADTKLLVANGGSGTVDLLDARTFAHLKTIPEMPDADNVRFDPASGFLFVGYGEGDIVRLDGNGKRLDDVRLPGHPESFQLETKGSRIFVNVPSASIVAVLDRRSQKLIARWPVTGARSNFPMALDESHHRLFLGCRQPAQMLVYDTETGKQVASVGIDGDTDDLFYDSTHKRLYVSCGAGFLDVIRQQDADHYSVLQRLPTAAGARTSLFLPERHRLYLAVPHRGSQQAEIRVYATQP